MNIGWVMRSLKGDGVFVCEPRSGRDKDQKKKRERKERGKK